VALQRTDQLIATAGRNRPWKTHTGDALTASASGTGKNKESAMTVTKLRIRPLGDKVLVKRIEAESMTAGGIVLPETAKEKPKRGRVQAVGDGKMLETGERSKLQVKKNDEVIFTTYAGHEIKIDGEEYLILDESEILAIVE
jgi:chaperonin GroES